MKERRSAGRRASDLRRGDFIVNTIVLVSIVFIAWGLVQGVLHGCA